MKLLLDTHLLLWTVSQSRRLSSEARELIGDPDNEPLFSIASLWEAAIKLSLGREDFRVDLRLLRRGLLDNSFEQLSVTAEHTLAVADLPLLHRDPFDRMLIAQSIVEGIMLLTADPVVARYPAPVWQV